MPSFSPEQLHAIEANMDNSYGSGDRIPRELMHSQDERLTNKHVKTLSFLQEIAKENKQLKLRIEELEVINKTLFPFPLKMNQYSRFISGRVIIKGSIVA